MSEPMTETKDVPIASGDYILQMKNITKEFSTVRVLDSVDFNLKRGEVHALMGENGAGKSTLMQILSGVYTKTAGEIIIDGKAANIRGKSDSEKLGIGMIFQEFSQAQNLSIAENLYLGSRPKKKALGFMNVVDWKTMREDAKKWLADFSLTEDPNTRVSELGVAKMQLIEIIKAVRQSVKILIMDEPTAALTNKEIEFFFRIIADLKKKGVSIIYISHRMEDIRAICDTVTVLRDGKLISTKSLGECTDREIITMMVGHSLDKIYPPQNMPSNEVMLEVKNLTSENKFEDVSFTVHYGEVVGFCGLVGVGKTEIAHALFGLDKKHRGNVVFKGKQIKITSPFMALKNNIALIPEDRKFQGVITKFRADENIALPNLKQFKNKLRMVSRKKQNEKINQYFEMLDIRPIAPEKLVKYFSGGNQQKIVIAKWLCRNAELYIFDEPTRGIDVGAKAGIYQIISDLTKKGCGVIICSSETSEILGMCNKIIVMKRKKIADVLSSDDADIESVLSKSLGGAN
ncbi:ribose import ATP-binding protein RbsA [Spirochaetia bacterium]|nr:ribose import ATP-binding protein RbsA [Spirochaetia bacterium]